LEESFKRRGEKKYSLQWGERLGFVMLAIKHGCEEEGGGGGRGGKKGKGKRRGRGEGGEEGRRAERERSWEERGE